MAKAMGAKEWTARAEAYEEAAGHLRLSWTDDPLEREQGDIIADKLVKHAKRCREIAATSTA